MKRVYRIGIYTLGMLVLALGLTLNSQTGLGLSPVLSVAYGISEIWGIKFGDATFIQYILFIAGEFIIRGKKRQWYDLLQLPFSLVFSRLLNVYAGLLPYNAAAHGLTMNLLVLVLSVIFTGIGVAMMVNMRLIPNPADGFVQAMSDRWGRDQGFMKNVFDVACVVATVLLTLVFGGQIMGVGIGTIVAMIGVGRVIALVNGLFQDKMCRAAGMI